MRENEHKRPPLQKTITHVAIVSDGRQVRSDRPYLILIRTRVTHDRSQIRSRCSQVYSHALAAGPDIQQQAEFLHFALKPTRALNFLRSCNQDGLDTMVYNDLANERYFSEIERLAKRSFAARINNCYLKLRIRYSDLYLELDANLSADSDCKCNIADIQLYNSSKRLQFCIQV